MLGVMPLASPSPNRLSFKRRRQYLLTGSLVLIALFIIALLLLPYYSWLFIPWIAAHCERQIGRKVSIDDLTMNLLANRIVAVDIRIKEQDGINDFLWLQKLQIEFSLAALVVGKILVPNCRVSGMRLRLELDAQGRANYRSILKHLVANRPASGPSPPRKQSIISLPQVKAHILLSDIDLHFKDAMKNIALNIDGLCLKCDIDSLAKIRWHSQWDAAEFQAPTFQGRAGYRFQGGAGLQSKAGRLQLNSYGQIDITPLHLTLAASLLNYRTKAMHIRRSFPGNKIAKLTGQVISCRLLSNDKLHLSWDGQIEFDSILKRLAIRHCRLEHQAVSLHFQGAIEENGGDYLCQGITGGCHGDLTRLPPSISELLLEAGAVIDGKFIDNFAVTGTLDNFTFTNRFAAVCDLEMMLAAALGAETASVSPLPQQISGHFAAQIINKPRLTVAILPTSLKIIRQQQPLLVSKLTGSLHDRRINGCRLSTTIYSQPLRQAAIRIAARWPRLQKQLQQRWQTSGNTKIIIAVHGDIDKQINAEVIANFDALECKWQDQQRHLLLAKTTAIPMGCRLRITHHLDKRRTIINMALLTLADLRLPLAAVKINNNRFFAVTGQQGVLLNIEGYDLAGLQTLFPVLKVARIQKAILDLQIAAIAGDLQTGAISGQCRLSLKVPFLSWLEWQKTTTASAKAPPRQESSAAPHPLVILKPSTQELLKKWKVALAVHIEKMQVDSNSHIEQLSIQARLNQKKTDNLLLCRIDGRINSGTITIAAKSNLNQRHPLCDLDYRLHQVPYNLDIFRPITNFLRKRFPIPILRKINFGNAAIAKCDLSGATLWHGIDWRVVQRSLISRRKIVLQFTQGHFDLGLDFDRFLCGNREQDNQVDQKLRQLAAKERKLKQESHRLQQQLTQEKKAIDTLEKKGRSFWQLIAKLKTLIAWNPLLKYSLIRYQGNWHQVQKEIAGRKQQQNRLERSLNFVSDKLALLQQQMHRTENTLRQSYDRLSSKWNIPNPFNFSFSSATMEIDIVNSSPWQGKGSSIGHNSSVIKVRMTFSASQLFFPEIVGECHLDGRYRFYCRLPKKLLFGLDRKIPALARLLKIGGVVWTDSGFVLSPF